LAVVLISPGFLPYTSKRSTPMLAHEAETIYIDSRRHGVVLVRPLSRALVLAALGGCGFLLGWPATVPGAVLLAVAALIAGGAVWRWDRTHLVVTTEKLFVVHGTLRRRSAAVHLTRLGTIELEQSLLGRIFGYGTIVAGELEIHDVARPREVLEVVQKLVR
jgi:membrane protein YdbS with pleckstrin-like domain